MILNHQFGNRWYLAILEEIAGVLPTPVHFLIAPAFMRTSKDIQYAVDYACSKHPEGDYNDIIDELKLFGFERTQCESWEY